MHTALETPSGTNAELLAHATSAAVVLRRRGAGPGGRVAIALPAGIDVAVTLHACFLLGADVVPIDLRISARERAEIADGTVMLIDEPLDEALAEPLSDERVRPHDLDAPAVVIHTSGTSFAPKPIELLHGNLLWSALGSAVALGLDPSERWLCALPLSHVGGLSILVRSAIYGTTTVVHERFETERLLRALQE